MMSVIKTWDAAEPTDEEKRQANALKKARLKYGRERRRAPKWMKAKRHGR